MSFEVLCLQRVVDTTLGSYKAAKQTYSTQDSINALHRRSAPARHARDNIDALHLIRRTVRERTVVIHANPRKCPHRLPRSDASSRLCCYHSNVWAALQKAVNVSLLCTSILRYWQDPFLFNMGQAPMFPRFGCRVLWEEARRRLARRLPFDHSKAISLIDFDSGQRPAEWACHPFTVEKLMKNGQSLSAAWSAHSGLPHRCREGCESQKSPLDVFQQELSHLSACWSYLTLSSGMSVVTSSASVSERVRPSSSYWFVVGSLSFFLENDISCVLSKDAALFVKKRDT